MMIGGSKVKTYVVEMTVAGVYLMVISAIVMGDDVRQNVGQVLSTVAVLLSFGHMTVSSRLEEAQDRSDVKTVDCYKKLTAYLVSKEVAWVAAFIFLEAWTALAGVPLFLLYPVWRRWYRARVPKS